MHGPECQYVSRALVLSAILLLAGSPCGASAAVVSSEPAYGVHVSVAPVALGIVPAGQRMYEGRVVLWDLEQEAVLTEIKVFVGSESSRSKARRTSGDHVVAFELAINAAGTAAVFKIDVTRNGRVVLRQVGDVALESPVEPTHFAVPERDSSLGLVDTSPPGSSWRSSGQTLWRAPANQQVDRRWRSG